MTVKPVINLGKSLGGLYDEKGEFWKWPEDNKGGKEKERKRERGG